MVNKMTSKTNTFNVVKACDVYNGLLPICDGSHIGKRVRTVVIVHDNVIDQSMRDVDITEKISAKSIAKFAVIKNARIFSPSKILKLDDKVAMALLSPLHVKKYLDAESYSGVFMTVLLFPLLSPFGKTEEIKYFETLLYASLYLNIYYTDYYNECRM